MPFLASYQHSHRVKGITKSTYRLFPDDMHTCRSIHAETGQVYFVARDNMFLRSPSWTVAQEGLLNCYASAEA